VFVYLLLAVLVAASIHIARTEDRTMAQIGRIGLLYILVGYCGLPMVLVSVWTLVSPDRVAEWLGFPTANPFQTFLGFAYLAMSIIAVLALRYRGAFLIGPAVGWAVFFAGATFVHLKDLAATGALTHHGMLAVLATHGLISLLLAVALLASGLLTERA
jgi:hypothetical protein